MSVFSDGGDVACYAIPLRVALVDHYLRVFCITGFDEGNVLLGVSPMFVTVLHIL